MISKELLKLVQSTKKLRNTGNFSFIDVYSVRGDIGGGRAGIVLSD